MKKHLKTGVSAAVLGLVMAGPAFAFDDVDWSWTSTINEVIDINIDIDANNSFYPTGITKAEQLQISGGNMTSVSNQNNTQFNVNNGGPGGPVEVDLGTLTVDAFKSKDGSDSDITHTPAEGGPALDVTEQSFEAALLYKNIMGHNSIVGAEFTDVIDLGSIIVNVPPGSTANLDARYDLGRLEGNSTAAANVASINSEVSTTFHDGQIAFGSFDQIDSLENVLQALGAGVSTALVLPTGNRNMDALAAAAIAAQFGLIEQGEISATATATNVLNAQVALNATGAGNMHSVTVGPAYYPVKLASTSGGGGGGGSHHFTPPSQGSGAPSYQTDNIVIGDLNQFSLMNVSASADASGLQINGYKNLGMLTDQYGTWTAASSVNASAFGNVSSITNRVNGLAPLPYVK